MQGLLAEVRRSFDVVLIDAPPLLPVADTLILGRLVDEVIVVYRSGQTPRSAVRLSIERLAAHQFHLLGLILNDMHPESADRLFLKMNQQERALTIKDDLTPQ
jgi:Mrp family chromosome partitioning ATPase